VTNSVLAVQVQALTGQSNQIIKTSSKPMCTESRADLGMQREKRQNTSKND